ncbi:MAG: 4-vinyl reductase [Candidatus Micrarchaeota archaeon]|nr:4-vinyl reductase [Candidatus Micrarchaeota archaeon]
MAKITQRAALKKKSSKPKLRAPKRRAIARRNSPRAVSGNLEDLLISQIALPKFEKQSSHLLPELLYNLTPSTRSLGYNSGFRMGERLSELHNASNSLHPLINALMCGGFSNVMYYPHKNSAIFEMVHHKECKMDLNATLHIFESGLIAGYLSHSTGARMTVTETMCAHDAKGKCQFVAERTGAISEPAAFEGTAQIVGSIRSAIANGNEKSVSGSYFALAIAPLTRSPLKEELAKLLFVVGRELSPTLELNQVSLERLATIFSLREAGATSNRKGVTSINFALAPISSTSNYLDLVAALFSGVLSHKAAKTPHLTRGLSRDGSYRAELKI